MRWYDLCLQPASAPITPILMPLSQNCALLHYEEKRTVERVFGVVSSKKCWDFFLTSYTSLMASLHQNPVMDANSLKAFGSLCDPFNFLSSTTPSLFYIPCLSHQDIRSAQLQKKALMACFPPSTSFALPAIIVCRLSGDDQRSGEDLVRGEEPDAKTLYLMSLAASLCSPHFPL